MNNWKKEIKEVGFKDWFWFVFVLGRDEFSHRLDLIKYMSKGRSLTKLVYDRNRAHRIDYQIGKETTKEGGKR